MVHNYLDIARQNEAIFRNILADLKENRQARPMGFYVPEDLNIEPSLEELFTMHSSGNRYGIFTIKNFEIEKVGNGMVAILSFENIACMSGGGAALRYVVNGTSVTYLRTDSLIMS